MIELEKVLEKYDKVFLFIERDKVHRDFIERFCASEVIKHSGKNVLILSTVELADGNGYVCRKLTQEKAQRLKGLYFLYEFSDRFKIFSWEDSFGSLINYIESGVLTWEEVFAAILH